MSPVSFRRHSLILLCFSACLLAGCNGKQPDTKSEAPPPAVVQTDTGDVNLEHVDHPDQFTLVPAIGYAATSTIQVTGTVNPYVSHDSSHFHRIRSSACHLRPPRRFVKKGQL